MMAKLMKTLELQYPSSDLFFTTNYYTLTLQIPVLKKMMMMVMVIMMMMITMMAIQLLMHFVVV